MSPIRVQAVLDGDKLQDIKKGTGIRNNRELIDTALTLLEWLVKERNEGRIVGSLDERSKRYREVLLPAIERHLEKSLANNKKQKKVAIADLIENR